MFDTAEYELRMQGVLEHFEAELRKIRTGRAHAGMLDGVSVEVYGSSMPLNQVANINAPEAALLVVTPFDPSNLPAISAAIRNNQGLGFNPSDDGRVVRIPVPPLTEERRKQLVRQASDKVEEARIALRTIRQEAFKDAKRAKDDKQLSEDDYKAVEKGIDDDIRQYQDKLDVAMSAKEKDILTI